MEETRFCRLETPVGMIRLEEDGGGITGLTFVRDAGVFPCFPSEGLYLGAARRQLEEYFAGNRRAFDVPLHPRGTPFQMAVWRALTEIPWGETRSYGDIALRLGRPGAARAVGMASHSNPISIFIPCHRVVGKTGKLTGYAGGLEKKAYLLSLEGAR